MDKEIESIRHRISEIAYAIRDIEPIDEDDSDDIHMAANNLFDAVDSIEQAIGWMKGHTRNIESYLRRKLSNDLS